MKKIPSVFQRNYEGDRLVRDEVVPGCEWVLAGAGRPTIKRDGTCCMIRDGKLYKRYELKQGRTTPANFEAAQEPDPVTGKVPGWVPVGDGPEDQYHREAMERFTTEVLDGTYELVGPKVQGGVEAAFRHHRLLRHGSEPLFEDPRTFTSILEFLKRHPFEGIVWHHPDGRMAKIKGRDFGLER